MALVESLIVIGGDIEAVGGLNREADVIGARSAAGPCPRMARRPGRFRGAGRLPV